MASRVPLEATPVLEWPGVQLTAVAITVEDGHTIAFLGDSQGQLHRVSPQEVLGPASDLEGMDCWGPSLGRAMHGTPWGYNMRSIVCLWPQAEGDDLCSSFWGRMAFTRDTPTPTPGLGGNDLYCLGGNSTCELLYWGEQGGSWASDPVVSDLRSTWAQGAMANRTPRRSSSRGLR